MFGHWSEASEHVESLLSGTANTSALRHWTTMEHVSRMMRFDRLPGCSGAFRRVCPSAGRWQRGGQIVACYWIASSTLAAELFERVRAEVMAWSVPLRCIGPRSGCSGACDPLGKQHAGGGAGSGASGRFFTTCFLASDGPFMGP